MPEELTPEQMRDYIVRQYVDPEQVQVAIDMVNRWLARGDKAAVYENQDLGHPDLGMCKITSYGSPAAQLESLEPPDRMPDIGSQVNWRYGLAYTCVRGPVPDADAPPAG